MFLIRTLIYHTVYYYFGNKLNWSLLVSICAKKIDLVKGYFKQDAVKVKDKPESCSLNQRSFG